MFGDFYVGVEGCEVAMFVWPGGVGDVVGGEVGTYVIGDDVEDVLVKVGCPGGRSQDLCGSFWILGSGCAHAISSLENLVYLPAEGDPCGAPYGYPLVFVIGSGCAGFLALLFCG